MADLDPVEEMMMARLADFFAENAAYDQFHNPSDWYKKVKLWENLSKMVGGTKHLNGSKFDDSNFNFDPVGGIFAILKGVYLEDKQRFRELLGFVLKKIDMARIQTYHDEFGQETTKKVASVDPDKIAYMNRCLSVFYLALDGSMKVSTSTGIMDSRAEDRKMALSVLSNYPAEREAFLGAIQRYAEGGTDAFRQAMSSCRNLIENLIKKISAESDWNKGRKKLLSETKSEMVAKIHHFLSGYGPHSPEVPEQRDVELALKLTEDVIVWLVKQSRQNP